MSYLACLACIALCDALLIAASQLLQDNNIWLPCSVVQHVMWKQLSVCLSSLLTLLSGLPLSRMALKNGQNVRAFMAALIAIDQVQVDQG